mgnify:CR=1 FL=1
MILAGVFGLVIGAALGLLGAGGSILAVPALVYGVGQPVAAAVFGSLLVVSVSAAGGVAARLRSGMIRWPVALVFGKETSGWSNEELGLCQGLVSIPANPDYSSLNLAAAVQVLSYEMRQSYLNHARWPQPEIEAASVDEVERFYTHLETTLAELAFLNPGSPGKLMLKLRRLFARTRLAKEEVNILRGILTAASDAAKRTHGTQSNNS